MKILGYKTDVDALKNACIAEPPSDMKRSKKEPIYAEYEALHPGYTQDAKNLEAYSIFYRNWTLLCPAWRSDRTEEAKPSKKRCGAIAIIIHRDEDGDIIFCPECLYEGMNISRF